MRLGGPQVRYGRVQKILGPPPPGFDPRTLQPVESRYTSWANSALHSPSLRLNRSVDIQEWFRLRTGRRTDVRGLISPRMEQNVIRWPESSVFHKTEAFTQYHCILCNWQSSIWATTTRRCRRHSFYLSVAVSNLKVGGSCLTALVLNIPNRVMGFDGIV